jgi:hypothetical protein
VSGRLVWGGGRRAETWIIWEKGHWKMWGRTFHAQWRRWRPGGWAGESKAVLFGGEAGRVRACPPKWD